MFEILIHRVLRHRKVHSLFSVLSDMKNSHTVLGEDAITKERVLNSRRLPGRLDVPMTAALLNFAEHDIAVLVAARLLRPLGNPAANAPKYFAAATILPLSEDAAWLSRATKAVSTYWKRKRVRGRPEMATLEK